MKSFQFQIEFETQQPEANGGGRRKGAFKLVFMLLLTIFYLAAVVALERTFEAGLDCKDGSFKYNVTVTVPLASSEIGVDLVCLEVWNFEKSEMQVLNVERWFFYEIFKGTANLLLVISITGIRWFKVVKRNNLLLISLLGFGICLITDIILITNCKLLFSIEAFKIDNMAFGNKSKILKIIEYVWLTFAFIFLNA